MPMTLTQIESEAAKLDVRQRTILVDHISSTLPVSAELESIWMEEAARRHASYKAGHSKARPVKDAMRDIRKAISNAK